MTFFGVIFFIFVAIGICTLLSRGIKCALYIDHWSDLWKKPKSEETSDYTIHVNIFSKSGGRD